MRSPDFNRTNAASFQISLEMVNLRLFRLLRSGSSMRLYQTAKDLLAKGADANFRPHSRTATMTLLGMAVQRCDAGVVSLLLRHGATVHTRFSSKHHTDLTALHVAAMPPDFDDTGLWRSACVVCCSPRCRHIRIVSTLLDHGADVNATDASNRTPLHYAAGNGMLACVQVLYERGADPHLCDRVGNAVSHTPIHFGRNALQHLLCAWENFMMVQVVHNRVRRVASSGSSDEDDEEVMDDLGDAPALVRGSSIHDDVLHLLSQKVHAEKVQEFLKCATTLSNHDGEARRLAFATGLSEKNFDSPVNVLPFDVVQLILENAMPRLCTLVDERHHYAGALTFVYPRVREYLLMLRNVQ